MLLSSYKADPTAPSRLHWLLHPEFSQNRGPESGLCLIDTALLGKQLAKTAGLELDVAAVGCRELTQDQKEPRIAFFYSVPTPNP